VLPSFVAWIAHRDHCDEPGRLAGRADAHARLAHF
jgi:hypothetical protein